MAENSFLSDADCHATRNDKKYIVIRSNPAAGLQMYWNNLTNVTTHATWNSGLGTKSLDGETRWMNIAADNAAGFQGKVGDMYLWDRRVTDAEVTTIFNNYKNRYGSVTES